MNAAKFIELWNKAKLAPKAMVVVYIVLFYQVVHWFMGLENPTMIQSGFVSVLLVGAGAGVFAFYRNSGGKND